MPWRTVLARVLLDLESAAGEGHRDTLRYLRAEIRDREVGGGRTTHSGGGPDSFTAGHVFGVEFKGKLARVELEIETRHGETKPDRPPIVVPPTVLVQRPPEAWGEGR